MKKGFTLLELIIVIMLTIVFSGLSLPYFNANTNEKKLDKEAKHVIDFIELAKQKSASSSISETNAASCYEFRGYQLVFDSAASYRLRACCSSSAQPTAKCASYNDFQQYTVPNNFSLTYSANLNSPNNYIFFPVLQLGTELTSDATITVRNSTNAECITITVNKVGIVTESPRVGC